MARTISDSPTPVSRGKRFLPWLRDLLLIAAGVVLIGVWQTRSLAEGNAPPFAGHLLSGEPTSLQAALASAQGKPLILHFWASWCGICSMMDGSVNAIAQDWPMLSVAYQSGEIPDVMRHMQNHGLDFPTLMDTDGTIGLVYGVTAVPTTFILKPDGEIAFRSVGYSTGWGLRLRLWLAAHF